jgi:hypothetical protein
MSDHRWLVDVLGDLMTYAEKERLFNILLPIEHVATALEQAAPVDVTPLRSRITKLLEAGAGTSPDCMVRILAAAESDLTRGNEILTTRPDAL